MESWIHNTTIDLFHQRNSTGTSGPGFIVNDFTLQVFDIVNIIILCGLIGMFGSVANVINMKVFLRLGIFTSVSNLNLFSLAAVDFGIALTTFLLIVRSVLTTANVSLNWNPYNVFDLTVSWPNGTFILTNRLITTFVAFERCICVVLPFKVRVWFTIRRSVICIVIILAYSFITAVPVFASHNLKFVLQDETNISTLVLVLSPEADLIYDIYINTNTVALGFGTVVFLFVVTLITSSRLRLSQEWRKSVSVKTDQALSVCPPNPSDDGQCENTHTSKSGRMTDERIDKEIRLVKIITLISIVYLVSFLPEFLLIIATFIDDRIRAFGQYWRLSHVLISFIIPITTINSSINILFYYRMSSAFRKEFRKLFGLSDAW